MSRLLLCGRYELDLARPHVMGILNVTPDSFSDGGAYLAVDAALAQARALIAQGADLLDLGAESTRPGAEPVSAEVQAARLLPVVEGLRDAGIPLSIDTSEPTVMRATLDAGADMINDIQALRLPGAIDAVVHSRCALCVMHMQGEPRTMQASPHYDDVVGEVGAFLAQRTRQLQAAGIDARRIVLDPGFGFGKTVDQNYALLRGMRALQAAGYPLLAGVSRKSMIGAVTGKPVQDRLAGSIAAALAAVAQGASLVRVHDVAATVDALAVWQAATA